MDQQQKSDDEIEEGEIIDQEKSETDSEHLVSLLCTSNNDKLHVSGNVKQIYSNDEKSIHRSSFQHEKTNIYCSTETFSSEFLHKETEKINIENDKNSSKDDESSNKMSNQRFSPQRCKAHGLSKYSSLKKSTYQKSKSNVSSKKSSRLSSKTRSIKKSSKQPGMDSLFKQSEKKQSCTEKEKLSSSINLQYRSKITDEEANYSAEESDDLFVIRYRKPDICFKEKDNSPLETDRLNSFTKISRQSSERVISSSVSRNFSTSHNKGKRSRSSSNEKKNRNFSRSRSPVKHFRNKKTRVSHERDHRERSESSLRVKLKKNSSRSKSSRSPSVIKEVERQATCSLGNRYNTKQHTRYNSEKNTITKKRTKISHSKKKKHRERSRSSSRSKGNHSSSAIKKLERKTSRSLKNKNTDKKKYASYNNENHIMEKKTKTIHSRKHREKNRGSSKSKNNHPSLVVREAGGKTSSSFENNDMDKKKRTSHNSEKSPVIKRKRTKILHSRRHRENKRLSSRSKDNHLSSAIGKVKEKSSTLENMNSGKKESCSQKDYSSKNTSKHLKRSSDPKKITPVNKYSWIRSSPADLCYIRDESVSKIMRASQELKLLHETFQRELVERSERVNSTKPKYEPPQRKTKLRKPKTPRTEVESSDDSSSEEDTSLEELEKKKKHPYRLHEELWYNDPGEMNDGPLCRCSAKAKRSGIRHGIYAGELNTSLCDPYSNNADKLFHYKIVISPTTNFLSKCPTIINHDGHDFIFEGFSLLSHAEIPKLPPCKVIRFNIEYTIAYTKEKFPENFTINGVELFSTFLFCELLELVDLNWKAHGDSSGCPQYHLLPRFTRDIESNGKELLSLNVVLQYLLSNNQLLIEEKNLPHIMPLSKHKWQDFADSVKGMLVTCPGMKPSSIRVDQLDREQCDSKNNMFPEIVHFGVRPPQLSYAGNPNYQKAWRDYVKFRHLLANKPKVLSVDKHKLMLKERRLQEMRTKNNLKRDVTVVISSKNFYKTGIMCDIVQHAMLLPVLICHLRFHQSLNVLENNIGYKFTDRFLLQLALTHPSYRENFGTNPDHARNSLTNCGIRQPEYGDRRIHYMNTRKRGINTLINIMSRFGHNEETESRINHNERLEFLGDAVVEFLSSIHLFFMFPNLEEGGLATYRAAIVQNQHLAVLAKKLLLERYMLYAHGSDLCHDLELRHAMANCFEALMGALFLDGGIKVADRVFSETLFEGIYLEEWVNYPQHPLQELEPGGDRKWISLIPILQKLSKFEESIGIEFTHIRLLARAMTHRSLGYNNLTMGSNQRLEFLGDTVLQLVASEYLYKFFPEHHEGHLSLLRSSLVNNRTQAVVCDDLGMVEYAIYPYSKVELKAKDRADLLEAFLGALYVDKDLEYCTKFCEVCFFPRLRDFIMNQEWNDPKSKLQQCCLTLRTMYGGEPDIPVYKVIECKGPTNTRVYSVAVYFRSERLAVGSGHSIQRAEMNAAENALNSSKDLFPQLDHQRRAMEKSLNQCCPSSKSRKR